MIVFAPAYDHATAANHAVASRIVAEEDTFFEREQAQRESLLEALRDSAEPLFLMSHGTGESVVGHNHCDALTIDDMDRLGARVVFAHACLTGHGIGAVASCGGATWWGYDVVITAPDDRPTALPVFVALFRFVKSRIGSTQTPAGRGDFFRDLAEECAKAGTQLDCLLAGSEPVVEAFLCLHNLEHDLLVWVPGTKDPVRSPMWRPPRTF